MLLTISKVIPGQALAESGLTTVSILMVKMLLVRYWEKLEILPHWKRDDLD